MASRWYSIAFAIAAAMAASVQPADAKVLSTFEVRDWSGAVVVDEHGVFRHCAVERQEANGREFILVLDGSSRWSVRIYDPRWTLPEGEPFPVRLSLDRTPLETLPTTVLPPHAVDVDLDQGAISALEKAKTLEFATPKESLSFPLPSIADALRSLRVCLSTHKPAGSGESGRENSPDAKFRAVADKILHRAGLERYQFSSEPTGKDTLAAWEGPDFNGQLSAASLNVPPATQLAQFLVAVERKCQAQYRQESPPPARHETTEIFEGTGECVSAAGSPLWVASVVVVHPIEKDYCFVVIIRASEGASETTRQAVRGIGRAAAPLR